MMVIVSFFFFYPVHGPYLFFCSLDFGSCLFFDKIWRRTFFGACVSFRGLN